MDDSDCGTGVFWVVTRSIDTLWVENGSVGVDTGAVDTLRVKNGSVGIETGAIVNSGVDNPEVDPKVGNGRFDVFLFVTLNSGRYSSSSSLLAVSVVTCIMQCRKILLHS